MIGTTDDLRHSLKVRAGRGIRILAPAGHGIFKSVLSRRIWQIEGQPPWQNHEGSEKNAGGKIDPGLVD